MKTKIFLLVALVALSVPFLRGADEGEFAVKTVELSGDTRIHSGSSLTVSFPTAMVSAAEIDMEAKTCPLRFEPALQGKFIWKSETEGEFTPVAVPPGVTYTVLLRPKLTDRAGKPVQAGAALGTRSSDPFTVEVPYYPEDSGGALDRRPSIPLRFHPDVLPADLVDAVWFQDRDSRQRFPVEVVLQDADKNGPVDSATVTPRADLPAGKTFDLIVEDLKEAVTGTRLPTVYVKPLGETKALQVVKVAAFNYPMHKRRIVVEFSDPVDPDEGRKIDVEPKVPGLNCIGKETALWLEGDFDLQQRYRVLVPQGVVGKRGFPLAAESRWTASFHPKKPQIVFPSTDLHQRSKLGLNFGFMQVNTGPLEWKLARVPPEKLAAMNRRVREFTEKQIDPVTSEEMEDAATGLPVWTRSELLIDACRLETVANGSIAPSPAEADTRRDLHWTPSQGLAAGAYVLEVSGTVPGGRAIANRALITFTEYAAAQKTFGETRLLRVMNIADGRVVAGVRIRALTDETKVLAEAVTDSNGEVRFQQSQLAPEKGDYTQWFLLETPDGPMLQPLESQRYYASGYGASQRDEPPAPVRLAVASDRPLYRPGQTVNFKGFVRDAAANGDLRVPRGGKVSWKITGQDDEEAASGTAKLDDFGGVEGSWPIPETVKVGQYKIAISSEDATGEQFIAIQEFRPPPFLVSFGDVKLPGAQAGARVSSVYFHGAPNAGARVKWEAVWTGRTVGDESILMAEAPREAPAQRERRQTVKGEGVLGTDGALELKSTPPFADGIPRGWYDVQWTAEVTAVDGQTITETATFPVYAVSVELSVNTTQVLKPAVAPLRIGVQADASAPGAAPAPGTPVSVELYRVVNKTSKEQISPFVFRYRNSVAYEKLSTTPGRAPFHTELTVNVAGEYLVAVRDSENAEVPATCRRAYVSGADEAEFPVHDEDSIGVTCDKPAKQDHAGIVPVIDEKAAYVPGEKAVFSVQSPFAGVAWVTVETHDVLDSFTIPLDGNSGAFELPIKKEYAPNAWVTVYLLHPGGADNLPSERFGVVRIDVRRPDVELKVTPTLAAKAVQPKETISGEIVVTSEGQPVANADLTVYAVDEAYLDAGDWHEPPLRQAMYPERFWGVSTYHGMEQLCSGVDSTSLHQKGFIIGGAGEKGGSQMNVKDLRTDFPPLAFWLTHLRTGPDGKAPFSFKAPDGLTKYRVIALAQTKQSQFGTGSDCVEVSKPMQIEPALPRFVRVGDQVELRAIVRQKTADELPVTVSCSTDMELCGSNALTQTVRRGVPAVFRFPARVVRDAASMTGGQFPPTAIRFETGSGSGDAVELKLPVYSPTLLRKESVFGNLAGIQGKLPSEWAKATGSVDVTVSSSPWLPKLAGLPLLLEYPHGCFEQITSRILGYSVLRGFLDYLPQTAGRETAYAKRIESGIQRMADNLTEDEALPYWPGGTPSAIPTIQGYWAARHAAKQGIAVPERLLSGLANSVRAIALSEKAWANTESYDRAFALMVLSESPDKKPFEPAVRELYLRREKLDDESRALLALAMQGFAFMPKEKQQLLREIDVPVKERAFDPDTFGSTTRAEALRALAFATIQPAATFGKPGEGLRKRIGELLDSSQSLSTQENFWLLLAFRAMHPANKISTPNFRAASPSVTAISRNGASALWGNVDIRQLQKFAVRMDRAESFTCLMQAQFRTDAPVTERTDRGFRIERVVKNLTESSRIGTAEAPFDLGDQILVTYRLMTPKLHHYVALEDELPAALETVNPDIASIARTYSIPQEKETRQLSLSYAERRDRITCLYFNRVEPGLAVYSVLARATCAGVFHWPATQVVPMYDSRFSGLSPSGMVTVGEYAETLKN